MLIAAFSEIAKEYGLVIESCAEKIDLGAYNTCLSNCKYCYANFNQSKVEGNNANYDIYSPLLCGTIGGNDVIIERQVESLKTCQMKLLD